MRGIVIEHGIENPLVLSIVDDREHTVWPLIELVCRHIARKRRQRPVQKGAVHLAVGLFFPRPRPSSGGYRRAQTPGGHATGASWRGDTACHLPPLSAVRSTYAASCAGCGAPNFARSFLCVY